MQLPDRVAILVNLPEHSNTALGVEAVGDVVDSARAIEQVLQGLGCSTVLIGTGRTPQDLLRTLDDTAPLLVVNLAEEAWGNDRFEPAVAYLLAARGIPFTGNPPEALAACRDKSRARLVALGAGVAVPRAKVFAHKPSTGAMLPYAAILKPACRDGSIGIGVNAVVAAGSNLRPGVEECAAHAGYPVLAEEFIDGRELNVTLAERAPSQWLVIASEIDFSGMPEDRPKILSYAAKWHEGSVEDRHSRVRPGIELGAELQAAVQATGEALIESLGLQGYARYDARLDSQGVLRVIDINPNPDIAPGAGVLKALASRGIGHAEFVREQVELAWLRARGDAS